MAQRFRSVHELAETLEDKDFCDSVRTFIERRSLAKQLAALRNAKGLSQNELAARIGCSQSHISKIEHAENDGLGIKDLIDYAKALGVCLNLTIPGAEPFGTAVEMVKYHAFEAKTHLDKLAALAGNDPKFKQAVADFYMEAIVNILAMCLDSANKLEPNHARMLELLKMSPTSRRVDLIVGTEDGAESKLDSHPAAR